MIYSQLPYKEIEGIKLVSRRVLFFDPSEVYKHITLQKNKRYQTISIGNIFPERPGLCSCGCGVELTGKRKKWATDECHSFAFMVQMIISGNINIIKPLLRDYHGWKCQECGCEDEGMEWKKSRQVVDNIQIDHIIAVKNGGGGCWLSGYRLLCHACHVRKTKTDLELLQTQQEKV